MGRTSVCFWFFLFVAQCILSLTEQILKIKQNLLPLGSLRKNPCLKSPSYINCAFLLDHIETHEAFKMVPRCHLFLSSLPLPLGLLTILPLTQLIFNSTVWGTDPFLHGADRY
jgi:hypothetical protein